MQIIHVLSSVLITLYLCNKRNQLGKQLTHIVQSSTNKSQDQIGILETIAYCESLNEGERMKL